MERNRIAAVSTQLCSELERKIHDRTGRRIRDLTVELLPERIVLRGRTTTYYAKQLAQHGISEHLPQMHLENAIVVESN